MRIVWPKLFFTSLTLLIAGCVAPGTSLTNVELPQFVDAENITPGNCLVVTRINVREYSERGRADAYLMIRDNSPVAFYNVGTFKVSSGRSFRVVAFNPGRYVWAELSIAGYAGVFKEKFIFECVNGRAIYIGDVDLRIDWLTKKYGISFLDNYVEAAADFAQQYPKIASRHRLDHSITADPRKNIATKR